MDQEIDLWQEIVTFLFQTPEGRGLVSTILTTLVGLIARLLLITGRSWIDRHELVRLEKQHELEAEIEQIKGWIEELGIEVDPPEENETEIRTNVRTHVPQ